MNARTRTLLSALLVLLPGPAFAQDSAGVARVEPVEFESADGVRVFGDLHRSTAGTAGPIIVLFHQAGSNARGEYGEIIPRLVEHGYSVLAVDLRIGGSLYGGENRTVKAGNLPDSRDYCSAYPDVVAAWSHVGALGFTGPRFAWGSSYSAALVIHLAADRGREMRGVLAFSPATGEPMDGCRPEQYLSRLSGPALILRPESEAAIASVAAQLDRFGAAGKEVYVARPGVHGSSMLSASRVGRPTEDTWNVVLTFLQSHSTPE